MIKNQLPITFFHHSGEPFPVSSETDSWLSRAMHKLPAIEHITIVICSDEELLSLNQEFLQHDYYTDILTFDMRADQNDPIEAELYISMERVEDNALTQKTDSEIEFRRVIIHGILHLCGYKDKSEEDQNQMRIAEDQFLAL